MNIEQEHSEMVTRKSWEAFQKTKLLWWINRLLHTFGWAIVVVQNTEDGSISEVFPARVKFRGFSEKSESSGFIGLAKYITNNAEELEKESKKNQICNRGLHKAVHKIVRKIYEH